MTEQKWTIKTMTSGYLVKGKNKSFTLNNKHDAKTLCNTLNGYEKDLQLTQNISKQYDKINKQIIALQMDLSNIQDTVNQLKETIQCMSK